MKRASVTLIASLVALVGNASSQASPNLSLDDPLYEELLRLRALGRLPTFDGGLWPITERHARELLSSAGEHPRDNDVPRTIWFAPLHRVRAIARGADDSARPYSTSLRPRDLAGAVAMTCERRRAEPCGDGVGILDELDTSVGYGDWVSGSLRLRANAGAEAWGNDLAIDRAYVNAEVGPLAFEVGRDVLALGSPARTRLGWSENAAPLDQVRVSTAEPYRLTSTLQASFAYVVGRLRAPQRYPGNLVTISHVQLDIANRLEVGILQLLQLGGDGTPQLGVWDFIAEHVRRRDASASATDSSNRRFGGDVSFRIPDLQNARLYYAVMFEDIRRARLVDAIRYDADHLVGVELAAIGSDNQDGLIIEWHQTGLRSQEHNQRTTGFTNRGFIVGSPLGPDAESLYIGSRLRVGRWTSYPWLELARLSSDTYELITDGPINRTRVGEDEARYRVGIRARRQIQSNLWIEAETLFEHVDDYGFRPGVTRNNSGVSASIVWYPRGVLGRLSLN